MDMNRAGVCYLRVALPDDENVRRYFKLLIFARVCVHPYILASTSLIIAIKTLD